MALMNLPPEILEDIFSRLPPQDSASLSHAHPVFGRVYRRRTMSDLEAAESWEDFAAVVDEVLDHHAGGALERLSIRLREKYVVEQDLFNTAVLRWMCRAQLYSVFTLELHGENSFTTINFNFITWEDLQNLHLEWIHFSQLQVELQVLIPPLSNLKCLNLQAVTIDPYTNLGRFFDACPNLRVFILKSCLGDGAMTINCPLLETLEISGVFEWTVTLINLPLLTNFHVWSQDLPQFRLLQHPISMAPIPPSEQDTVANVQTLFITVDDNLSTVIRFIQYFHHSLRHLHLSWFLPANMEYQFDNTQELEELDTITIGGAALYDDPLRIMVEYILAHSPSLSRFTLMVPGHSHCQVIANNYLSQIEHSIMGLPRSSQQVQFEIF